MPSTNLRVPDDLWKDVKRRAREEHTSANAVVIKALEAYVSKRAESDAIKHLKKLKALVGVVTGGPSDMADEHDAYLQDSNR